MNEHSVIIFLVHSIFMTLVSVGNTKKKISGLVYFLNYSLNRVLSYFSVPHFSVGLIFYKDDGWRKDVRNKKIQDRKMSDNFVCGPSRFELWVRLLILLQLIQLFLQRLRHVLELVFASLV